jgi:hypothetical protein
LFVVPTLAVVDGIYSRRGGLALLDDPDLRRRLFPDDRQSLDISSRLMMGAFPGDFAHALAAVRLLHDAGVPILAGTDAPNPGTVHGATLHRELELLVRAGLSPLDALRAATSAAARAFGLDDRGRIARGLRADVVLVDGDPTTDIRKTRAVVGVWKEGRRYKLDLYDAQLAAMNAAASSEVGGPPPAGAESGIVSLFDESDAIGQPPRSRFGSGWALSTDAPTGSSTVTLNVVADGAEGTRGALDVRGAVHAGPAFAYAGAHFRAAGDDGVGVNLSSFDTLSFRVRGDGGSYMVYFYSSTAAGSVARYEFRAGADWSDVVVPFAQLGYDGRALRSILFVATGAPRSFSFLIDDVRFR